VLLGKRFLAPRGGVPQLPRGLAESLAALHKQNKFNA
jgi:hypothetical protein